MTLTVEEQVDLEDWERFRRLDRLADHWWWRPGWRPERHYLTWYVVVDDAALRAHVAGLQAELADLDHLDPVPLDGLHLTVQGVPSLVTLRREGHTYRWDVPHGVALGPAQATQPDGSLHSA